MVGLDTCSAFLRIPKRDAMSASQWRRQVHFRGEIVSRRGDGPGGQDGSGVGQ